MPIAITDRQISRTLAHHIRRLLTVLDISQNELAAKSGVDAMTISRVIKGQQEPKTCTLARIAKALDIDATQVRKDFAAIGLLGTGRGGFDVCEVCRTIRTTLGFDQRYEAVLIGTGYLGSALLAYSGFAGYGLHIVAAFDSDQRKVGSKIAGHTIKSTMLMKSYIQTRKIRLVILTTPVEVSQELTDRLVSAGVEVIWNFTPTRLTVPEGVLVRNEHISIGLSEITYHLRQ